MCKRVILGLALGLLASFCPSARAEDVQALLARAIKAHGGEEKLARTQASQLRGKGTLFVLGEQPVTLETSVHLPSKFRVTMEFQINGMPVTTTQVYNGEKFWVNVNGQDVTALLGDKAAEAIKEQLYQDRLGSVIGLKDKGIELSSLGELMIANKPALGIRASSAGHQDVSLWFDKETALLVKVEGRNFDPQSMQEVAREKFLSHYKEMDGLQMPSRVTVHQDGKKLIELEVTEMKLLDKLDDNLFTKP